MSRSLLSSSSPSTGRAESHVEGCAECCAKAVIVWEVVREAVWKARRLICLELSLFTQHASYNHIGIIPETSCSTFLSFRIHTVTWIEEPRNGSTETWLRLENSMQEKFLSLERLVPSDIDLCSLTPSQSIGYLTQ